MLLDFLVSRRGLDPAAETCWQALRHLLGLPVAGVERGELWRFDLEDGEDASACRGALERAACRAGRYVNLNRDACVWLAGPRPYPRPAPVPGTAADVWVRDGEGRDPAALEFFRSQGTARLRDLGRGVLWRLWLPDRDADAARRRAESIAVTRSRREGLLMNPHAQRAEVLHVVCSPAGEETR